MARCTYCRRRFRSEQAVRAHLKHCPRYKTFKSQEASALGSEPKAAVTPTMTPFIPFGPQVTPSNLSAPLVDSMKLLTESMAKLEKPPSAQQRRRKVLQSAKDHVIDHYYTASGMVNPAMRGAAKMAIERELATLPLEELPFEEVLELAIAIRARLYAPVFRKQTRETERQRVEQQAHHRKDLEALGALIRAARRKDILISQAKGQALGYCEEHGVIGLERLSLVGDITACLTEFLSGDESLPEAQAMVEGVLAARFAEGDARLAGARARADAKWRDDLEGALVLGALAGLVGLALTYPAQALPIFEWIERTFGLTPAAETDPASTEASESAASSASASTTPPRRRRWKEAAPPFSPGFSPWGHPVQPTTPVCAPHPPEERMSSPLSARGADGLGH